LEGTASLSRCPQEDLKLSQVKAAGIAHFGRGGQVDNPGR
jgi:hypothetical protein